MMIINEKKLVEKIDDIDDKKNYALIIDGFFVREMNGTTLKYKSYKLKRIWISTRILFEVIIES